MKKRPALRTFFLISILIHLIIATTHKFYPNIKSHNIAKKKSIKVRFTTPKISETPKFIETLKPKSFEVPKKSDFVSKYNRKALSSAKKNKNPKQTSRKITIPKMNKKKLTPMSTLSQDSKLIKKLKKPVKKKPKPLKKEVKKKLARIAKKTIKTKRKLKAVRENTKLKISEKLIEPSFKPPNLPKQKLKSSQFNQTGSLLAMINGIDSDKYASIDTNEKESGDEEEISLNTKKIKYADYMARIKHQIEKVWTYPEQAARNGISGQITLRFKLSRDGNLLSIRMLESSGEKILDMAAIKAVKGAAPYYPFPKTLTTKRLVITASFLYSPSYSKPYAYR